MTGLGVDDPEEEGPEEAHEDLEWIPCLHLHILPK